MYKIGQRVKAYVSSAGVSCKGTIIHIRDDGKLMIDFDYHLEGALQFEWIQNAISVWPASVIETYEEDGAESIIQLVQFHELVPTIKELYTGNTKKVKWCAIIPLSKKDIHIPFLDRYSTFGYDIAEVLHGKSIYRFGVSV